MDKINAFFDSEEVEQLQQEPDWDRNNEAWQQSSDSDDDDSNEQERNGYRPADTKSSDDVGGRPQTQPTTLSARRRRKTDVVDNRAALEHIAIIGNYHRHRSWRLREFKRRKKRYDEGLEQKEGSKDKNDDDESKMEVKKRLPTHFLHAEDVRLYGTGQGPAAPWPNSLSTPGSLFTKVHDVQWDLEHGDRINQLQFARDILSAVPHEVPWIQAEDSDPFATSTETETLLEPSRVNSLDADRLEFLNPEDAPRALLLRCWQRAMDAASFSALQPNKFAARESTSIQYHSSSNDPSLQQQPQEGKNARKRCEDLLIEDLGKNVGTEKSVLKCRVCGLDFDSRQDLQDHFYGNEKRSACSLSLIKARQMALISEALVQEIKSQTEVLTHLVYSKAEEMLTSVGGEDQKRDNNKRNEVSDQATGHDILNDDKKLLNWEDIVSIMRQSLRSSEHSLGTIGQSARGQATDTVDVDTNMAPLVLNEQVLESVSLRLTQRYANVPY